MTVQHRTPIGPEDVISIRGRYLYRGNSRFFVKGIAFPNIPPALATVSTHPNKNTPSMDGWIAVLEQLAMDTDINTIRIYELDCYEQEIYDAFFKRACELGVYVMIPLTGSTGDGNLKRDKLPPECYPSKLFEYGRACMDAFWDRHPNVLMGVVGNEVMNNIQTYQSAPCVKAYLDDLTEYGLSLNQKRRSKLFHRETFPLLYATQHDSPTAEVLPEDAIKLTLDYLSCGKQIPPKQESINMNPFVFGINIESWCSSSETFLTDGVEESSYHALWRTFSGMNQTVETMDAVTGARTTKEMQPLAPEPVEIPVIFSELGCSKLDFDQDNPNVPPEQKHIRDWKQIELVSSRNGSMADLWSGFVSYGYDGGGNRAFAMMGVDTGGSVWNGKDPLPPSKEYKNFRDALKNVQEIDAIYQTDSTVSTEDLAFVRQPHEFCNIAAERIKINLGVELYPLSRMPSHFHKIGNLIHHSRMDWRRTRAQEGMIGSSSLYSVALLVVFFPGLFFLWNLKWHGSGPKKNIHGGARKPLAQRTNGKYNQERNDSIESSVANYGTL